MKCAFFEYLVIFSVYFPPILKKFYKSVKVKERKRKLNLSIDGAVTFVIENLSLSSRDVIEADAIRIGVIAMYTTMPHFSVFESKSAI